VYETNTVAEWRQTAARSHLLDVFAFRFLTSSVEHQ